MDCLLKYNCKKYKNNECNDSFCIKKFKVEHLQKNGLLTPKQCEHIELRIDSDGTDKKEFTQLKSIENNIEKFVEDGKNLYIFSSNVGNGKTAWSLRLLNSYINAIWWKSDIGCRVLFIHVPRFLLALKDNISNYNEYANYIKENVLSADLVVWDEVGTKGLTEFEHENILNYVNCRIDSGKSNIYTSNLNADELKQSVGDRLFSRIYNYSEVVKLQGRDKRGLLK